MKKIFLIVSVALLICATLVVSCSAATYEGTVSPGSDRTFFYNGSLSGYDSSTPSVTIRFDTGVASCFTFSGGSVDTIIVRGLYNGLEYLYEAVGVAADGSDVTLDGDVTISGGDVSVVSDGNIDFVKAVFRDITGNEFVVRGPSLISSILSNFGSVLAWIPGIFIGLIAIFWTGSALTPLGYLAIAGLSISVILLIVYLISRFLKFRG